jgi:hypothetical protein
MRSVLVVRLWILVVPALVVRVLLPLVVSAVELAVFSAAVIRTA